MANLEIEGENKYNAMDKFDNIRMGIAGLKFYKDYWSMYNISEEDMFFYITNSYNMGIGNYTKYVKKNKTLSRAHSTRILEYKMGLELIK